MSAAMRHSLTSRLAAKARAEAEALAAECPAGRRRSTKLSRSLPLWKRPWSGWLRKRPRSYAATRPTSLRQPRRREAQTLWTGGPGPARTRPPLHRHRVPPLQMTTNGRRYPAQRLSPRPGPGRPLLSGSSASAPRAPLTRQAIQTSRYPGAIFSLTARCTFDRYGGRCRKVGCSPPLPVELFEDPPAATGPGEC